MLKFFYFFLKWLVLSLSTSNCLMTIFNRYFIFKRSPWLLLSTIFSLLRDLLIFKVIWNVLLLLLLLASLTATLTEVTCYQVGLGILDCTRGAVNGRGGEMGNAHVMLREFHWCVESERTSLLTTWSYLLLSHLKFLIHFRDKIINIFIYPIPPNINLFLLFRDPLLQTTLLLLTSRW